MRALTFSAGSEKVLPMPDDDLLIRPATQVDAALLVEFIRALADYEKLLDEVVATEESVSESLFGEKPAAEALIGEWEGEPAAFAVYFQNFSTFTGRAGLYLEDLFVKPEYRERGIGKGMLKHLAKIAVERGCPRFEWIAFVLSAVIDFAHAGFDCAPCPIFLLYSTSNSLMQCFALNQSVYWRVECIVTATIYFWVLFDIVLNVDL